MSDSTPAGFDLQGHRGARGLFPENTVEGIRAALALGARSVECDVAVTADDVPVLSHDVTLCPDVVRGPDGQWVGGRLRAVRELTLAQLAAYDVGRLRPGSAYATQFPDQVPQDGLRMPRLADALDAAAPALFHAELKTSPAEPGLTVAPEHMAALVLAEAERAGALDRITLRSFHWRGLRHARRLRPGVPRIWLTRPGTVDPAWWDGTRVADFDGSVPRAVAAEDPGACWAPEHAALTAAEVAEAHALGLLVVPWTVNRPADMARLIGWGVDGLCTDRPDLALAVMRAARIG